MNPSHLTLTKQALDELSAAALQTTPVPPPAGPFEITRITHQAAPEPAFYRVIRK